MKRPAFWILLVVLAIVGAIVGSRYFPQAFSIVALDITMDRERALADARVLMERDRLGPEGFRQAASFGLDDETQTFVELEGGGKDAFTAMLRSGLYSAYTWRVRHFKEGEVRETTIRFTPDGKPYGFVEQLKEDAPGAALSSDDARRIADESATSKWQVDLRPFSLIERGQERRPGGRVDHTFTYERATPTLNEGRYRLRLVVSGDRLSEVTHFVKIPEAFNRRYASMRSANEAIGVASVVGMALVYVVGGIGIGSFFMLRERRVLWRQPLIWGAIVSFLQVLAAINEWPLLWMTYDTAIPRGTFIGQQLAGLAASFVGFAVFFGLSFMAAETLTRKAFGSHPQFWKVWGRGRANSTAILGRTVGGYLLVSIFFAYDVVLYLVTTRVFGWWSPAEALLHPDVLATYAPWLSAIANSFQAGFWEESLFRAVPLAGAALIGDRFGQRRLFLVIGFIVQALIFGAGHAPYPNQPSFARPVELIIPSIGFGLLYVYFGLLPGIVLHFTFDVVWFALPIFMARAPGIWFQQGMVIVVTLVPLFVVLWRRAQEGRWVELSPADRNAAWTPPPAEEKRAAPTIQAGHVISPRAQTVWYALAAVSLALCAFAALRRSDMPNLPITSAQASDVARKALANHGFTVQPPWRILPVAQDGSVAEQEFVSETAGEDRRNALLGLYLPKPHWRVRVARFEGDVAETAEEWLVVVSNSGEVRNVIHQLPEARPGASLDEDAARLIAQQAVLARTGLDAAHGDAKEVLAKPSKLKARTDWEFNFVDMKIPALPQGEPRVAVEIAGDQVTSVGRFVHLPEDWERRQRATETRGLILRILNGIVFAGLLAAAGVLGVIAWSRRRYAPWLFLAGAGLMLVASFVNAANGLPRILAGLPTAQPLNLQLAILAGVGLVGLTVVASFVGLTLGSIPHQLASGGRLRDRDAVRLGIAAGLVGAAIAALAAWLRTPVWARVAEVSSLGTEFPFAAIALEPVAGYLTRMAVILAALTGVHRFSVGWTRRRGLAALLLLVVGFLGGGQPEGSHVAPWIASGLVTALGFLGMYVLLLRADLTMVPLTLGTIAVISALSRGLFQPFWYALPASLLAALIVAALAWWWFRALRRNVSRAEASVRTVDVPGAAPVSG